MNSAQERKLKQSITDAVHAIDAKDFPRAAACLILATVFTGENSATEAARIATLEAKDALASLRGETDDEWPECVDETIAALKDCFGELSKDFPYQTELNALKGALAAFEQALDTLTLAMENEE